MEDPDAPLPSTETISLAADDQQPPPLPPQSDDVTAALESFLTDELTTSDLVMVALEPRLKAADQAFLSMFFAAWRASKTLHGIAWRSIKNQNLLSKIFDAWRTCQQPDPDNLPPTTNAGTHHISDQTPPTSNTSEDITQLLNDLESLRPPHAPPTEAEVEQLQEETDSVLS